MYFPPSHNQELLARHTQFSSVQFSRSVFATPRTSFSLPGFPAHHQLPELTQTHVHRVSGAIQPSHPLSSPSPPAFNLSQHQGLFPGTSLPKIEEEKKKGRATSIVLGLFAPPSGRGRSNPMRLAGRLLRPLPTRTALRRRWGRSRPVRGDWRRHWRQLEAE